MMGFFEDLKAKHNINLNEQQREAVVSTKGSCLLISVPGSGKTATITAKIAYMITVENIAPESILTLTFSRAAAKDMKDRFYTVFGDICTKEVHFSTIHSFAFSVIRYYHNKHRMPMPEVIEGEETKGGQDILKPNKSKLLRQIYFELNNEIIADDLFDELQNQINYIKNMLYSDSDIDRIKTKIPKFKELYRQYEAYKRKFNLIDYSDMVNNALDILRRNPDILNAFKNQYKYILVDEAQDTSVASNALIRTLAYPENNVFFAGDDDQTLYSMNGCSPKNMFDYKNKYPGIKVLFMEQNYRSTANILNVANKFIKKNKSRYEKNIKTDKEPGRNVDIIEANNEIDQYRYVAEEIIRAKGIDNSAILYRTNITSIPIADILDRYGIPFYIRDTKPHFFNHWITQDLSAYISFALDRRNLAAFKKIYYKLNSYITKAAVEYVEQCVLSGDKRSILTILMDAPEVTPKQIERYNQLEKLFNTLGDRGTVFAIEYIKKGFKYEEYLEKTAKDMGYSLDYLRMILAVHISIAEGTNTIEEYLYRLDELKEIMDNSKANRRKAVTLSTLHSSKGLEFDNVYLVDMVEGTFPTYSAIADEKDNNIAPMEEERRLCYVGITRARKYCAVLAIDKKAGSEIERSRFVYELADIINPGGFKGKSAASKNELNTSSGSVQLKDLGEGIIIEHKKFGEGIIIDMDGDLLKILFEKCGPKQLLASACIQRNLLKIKQ